jgi:hypothetical protein
VGQKFIPGLLDEYLGRTGYKAQQHDGKQDPNAPSNLWESVPGNFGAHGTFDDRAHPYSTELWLDTHRNWIWALPIAGMAATAVAGGMTYLFLRKKTQKIRRSFRFLQKIA